MPALQSRRPGGFRIGLVFLLGYLALYAVLLACMVREGFNPAEPLFVLVVLGGLFSLLALGLTRGIGLAPMEVRAPVKESIALVGWLLVIVAFLLWGLPVLQHVSGVSGVLAIMTGKLVVFAVGPALLWGVAWQYPASYWTKAGASLRRCLPALLGMSAVLVAFQLVFGSGGKTVRTLAPHQLALGIPLAFVWLFFEVGIVEEFFFRALLQSRLTALVRSELAGIVLMALLFGLAHAPGLYFRPQITQEAIGHAPTPLFAIGYSVVIVSTTGFFLGVLWSRTRNLGVLAAVHAAGDLIPNLAGFLHDVHLH